MKNLLLTDQQWSYLREVVEDQLAGTPVPEGAASDLLLEIYEEMRIADGTYEV